MEKLCELCGHDDVHGDIVRTGISGRHYVFFECHHDNCWCGGPNLIKHDVLDARRPR